jgi:hypothetical protein
VADAIYLREEDSSMATIHHPRPFQQEPSGDALDSAATIARTVHQRRAQTARTAFTICAQLEPLWVPGSVRELRILGTSQGTVAAFCTTPQAVAEIAAPFNGRAQLYLTCNLVHPTLPGRLGYAVDRLIVRLRGLSGDADIVRRVLIFTDVDPVRDPHLSATEVEHRAALDRVAAICAWLSARGVSADSLMTVDSGNGAYLLPRIDLPNTLEASQLVARVTRTIAAQFADTLVTIDDSLTNSARIMKLVGTRAMKGPNAPDRPHRQAQIIRAPDELVPIPESLLREIAALAPPDPAPAPSQPARTEPYTGPTFSIDVWLKAHAAQLPPLSAKWVDWRTDDGIGRKRHFKNGCPFGANHASNNAAFIGVRPNGAIVCVCLHHRCNGKDWHLLRDLYESAVVIEV